MRNLKKEYNEELYWTHPEDKIDPFFIWAIKSIFNNLICTIFGHDLEYVCNEPDVENGPSENDVEIFCKRCSK